MAHIPDFPNDAYILNDFRNDLNSMLPSELLDTLKQVYLMHRMAIEPEKVLPPGKTLVSYTTSLLMEMENKKGKEPATLTERVEEVAHKAFWNEVVETLSSPLPSVQLPRLKLLYADLANVVEKLIPDNHKVMQTLRSQLAPTTSPLLSTLAFLKELLQVLRKSCAPARDLIIDQLYTRLDEWRHHSANENQEPLPVLISETMRGIVDLAGTMRQDVSLVAMGVLGEDRIKPFIATLAKSNERDFLLNVWDDKEPQGQVLRARWSDWYGTHPETIEAAFAPVPPGKGWIVRLLKQLFTNVAISCDLPRAIGSIATVPPAADSVTTNELPPQFFFIAPKLSRLQNIFQAITIAAALRSLTRLPNPPLASQPPTRGQDFLERVWTLLEGEVQEDGEGLSGSTKINNLAEEVIRARRLSAPTGEINAEEESRLRAAVERTLRPQDPVFQLLHRRLHDGLTKQTLSFTSTPTPPSGELPVTMRAGRAAEAETAIDRLRRAVVVPDLGVPPILTHTKSATATVVKGFEGAILSNAVQDAYRELLQCVTWLEYTWGDTMW